MTLHVNQLGLRNQGSRSEGEPTYLVLHRMQQLSLPENTVVPIDRLHQLKLPRRRTCVQIS